MKKKVISFVLAAMVLCASLFALAGCGDGEYPVNVANLTISKSPQSIVVLDASTADIISYIGYDRLMVGRSDQVDQSYLAVAPSFGSEEYPDVQGIIDAGTDVVFANDKLNAAIQEQLEDANITVVTMSLAETPKQLETNYRTIGKILGGNVTGDNKGAQSFSKLIDSMEGLKAEATAANNANALNTVCYLYYENNGLKLMTSGTYGDMLLGYTGAVNVAVNIEENSVDVNTLKIANPNYVFYADEATLNAVESDSVLSQLGALAAGKAFMITREEMNRQGLTALETLEKMIGYIHPELRETPDEPQTTAAAQTDATVPATDVTQSTEAGTTELVAAAWKSVTKDYDINLRNLHITLEDESDDVKKVQQRLFDLGYIVDEENVTGYFGEVSKQAVEAFQENNDLEVTGEADTKTLVAMFKDNAKKAE